MRPEQREAVDTFVAQVRQHYGVRLHGIFAFGSRARHEATEQSDLDIAIVLDDDEWDFWAEKRRLAGLSYEALIDQDIYIQSWPIKRSVWNDPLQHRNPRFIENMRRDACDVRDAA